MIIMIKPMIVIIKNLHVSGKQRWESQASLVSLPLFPISCRKIVWLSFLFSLHPWLKGTRRDLTNAEVMYIKILNCKEKSFKVLKLTMTTVPLSDHILYNYQGSFSFFLIRSRPKYTFVDLENEEETCWRILNWKETGFKVLKSTTVSTMETCGHILSHCVSNFKMANQLLNMLHLFGNWFTTFGGLTYFIRFDLSFFQAITLWAISLLGRENLFLIPTAASHLTQELPIKSAGYSYQKRGKQEKVFFKIAANLSGST